MLSDVTAVGLAVLFIIALSQLNPVKNDGKLTDVSLTSLKTEQAVAAGGEPAAIVDGQQLASISGIRNRSPLSSCGVPQGVGISTRLLPPKDAEKFDDSDFLALDAQGLAAKNFLSASARIGHPASTSSRVQNHQLRSEPVVERTISVTNTPFNVSPHGAHAVERGFEIQSLSKSDIEQYKKAAAHN